MNEIERNECQLRKKVRSSYGVLRALYTVLNTVRPRFGEDHPGWILLLASGHSQLWVRVDREGS